MPVRPAFLPRPSLGTRVGEDYGRFRQLPARKAPAERVTSGGFAVQGFAAARGAGLELCQRKWRLEALLHELDHSGDPPAVLELVPASDSEASHSEAA